MNQKRKGFSPDQHQRQTQSRLIAGGLLVLLVVGGGLVWVLYGRAAALVSVACLLGGAGLLALLWFILTLLEAWVKDDEP